MRLFIQQENRYPNPTGVEGAWVLLLNSWNDFGYRTLFGLHQEKDGKFQDFGFVKILKKGQKGSETPLPEGELKVGCLPDGYVSLGSDLDYYVRLTSLGKEESQGILNALRDISIDTARSEQVEGELGLEVSLHRDHSRPRTFYRDAHATIESGGALPGGQAFSFEFTPGGADTPITFSFEPIAGAGADFAETPSHRLVVLVGRNGVGKTRLLAQLARVAYAPPKERDAVAEHGRFEGAPAFPSVVAVSYSAFDDFEPPSLDGSTNTEVAEQLRMGTGRYAYCGMRDLAEQLEKPGVQPKLLSQSEMEWVFGERIGLIRALDRTKLLAQALSPVFSEESFRDKLDIEAIDALESTGSERNLAILEMFLGDEPTEAFRSLSSGHKIVVHLIANLTASLKHNGLALIDEPETHLHPPLLAAMMTGVRRVLRGLRSYAIVATHSPVVAQETLARYVLVIESGPYVRGLENETFGENTGALTRELFGLHTNATDFRRVLNVLINDLKSIEAIEEHLGSTLSPPSLAYVMARIKGPSE